MAKAKVPKKVTGVKRPQTGAKAKTTFSPKAAGIEVPLYQAKGTKSGTVTLAKELFGQTLKSALIAQAARVYQVSKRQGTRSTKTRGEVTGSTRKIYRQKGTGRARHGAITAPIFVGGGITFGPKPHDPSLKFPSKMRRQALTQLLSLKVKSQALTVVAGLGGLSGKTKEAAALLKSMRLVGKRLLVVTSGEMDKAVRATRNIEDVVVRPARSVPPLDVLRSEHVIFAKEALSEFSEKKTKGKTV